MSRNAPLRVRKRRSDAVYASNAERQRAYRRRKAAKSGRLLADLIREHGLGTPPEGEPYPSQIYGMLGNVVKRSKSKRAER
jgi:hypothetical protein